MVPAHIRLTPLRPEDSDQLFAWINDSDLVNLNAPFKPVSRPDHERWFASITARRDVAIFAIRLGSDDRLIGTCQLNEIDRDRRTCRLQIRIGDRREWAKGYGTEAVTELLRHAWGALGMRRVSLDVFADNARAIRAYEKAGFSRAGATPGAVVIKGERKDLVEMTVEVPREMADG